MINRLRPALPPSAPPRRRIFDCVLDRVTCGAQTAEFQASGASDPFPEMVKWLEALARGETPELVIDAEAWFIWLRTAPAANAGDVRFGVASERHILDPKPGSKGGDDDWRIERTIMIDALVPRRALVQGAYRALVARWEQADTGFWEEWLMWSDGCARSLDLPETFSEEWCSVRSETVEAWLTADGKT